MKADEVLMEEIKAGNKQAFDLLLHRYEKALLNYIYRLVGNFHQAEEISQEAFFRVYKCALKFNSNQKFSSWLYKIASNLCIDEFRKKKSIKVDISELDLPSPENLEEKIENMELQCKIRKAVLSLPEAQRSVFILKHYQELSYNEIGEILGCPVGTIKSRMHYALMELKKALA